MRIAWPQGARGAADQCFRQLNRLARCFIHWALVASDLASKAQIIEFGFDGIQPGFDIAEAVSVSYLSKGHAEDEVEAGEMPDTIISFLPTHAAVEIALEQGVHELDEEITPGIHRQAPSTVFRGRDYGIPGEQVEFDPASIDL